MPSGERVQRVVLVPVQAERDERLLADLLEVPDEVPHPGDGALDVGIEVGQDRRPPRHMLVYPVSRRVAHADDPSVAFDSE